MSIYYVCFIVFLEYSFFEVTHQQCPCTAKQTTKFELLLCNCPRTWSEADVECRSKGAVLARIDNRADDRTITTELGKLNVGQAWIGGKIDAGDWRWIQDKSPMYGQGCYSYPSDTSLFTHTETSQQTSVSGCVSTCKQRGQPYAGLYKGDTCLCMKSYNTTTLSSGCTEKCKGNVNERCGGSNVFYVYATSVPAIGQWKLGYPSSNYPDHMCVKVTCEYLPMATWKLRTDNCKARHKYLCVYKKDGLCPSNSLQIGNLCYTRSSLSTTWYDANLQCAQNGGILADITSPDVYNTLVSSRSSSIRCYDGSVWLGASKSLLSWTTGQMITFTNWGSVYPSRLSFTKRCLYLTNQFNLQHQWADEICDLNKAFVCMKGLALTTTTTIRPTTTTTTSTTTTRPTTTTTTTRPTVTTTTSTTTPSTTTSTTTTKNTTPATSSSTTTTSSTTRTSQPTTTRSTTPKTTSTSKSTVQQPTQPSTTTTTKSTTVKPIITRTTTLPTSPLTTRRSGSVTTLSPSTSSTSDPVLTTTRGLGGLNKTSTAMSTQSNTTIDPGATPPVQKPEMTTGSKPDPEPEFLSSEDVGGIILIIVAVIILSIFFVMSVLCCLRPCIRSYFKSKKLKKTAATTLTNTNPRRAFVRDTDFAYLDVSHDKSSLTKGKGSQPVYDKEKSLQRYHSLDIDKGLKKEEMGPRANMNYLNNQTQTGNSLNSPDSNPQYNIPAQPKGHLEYIDNVGAYPAKDSNLQQNKVHFTPKEETKPVESKDNQVSIEVHNPVSNHVPQKTVIQVTGDKDIIEEPNSGVNTDFENQGYIHEDVFINADYEDPRDYTYA